MKDNDYKLLGDFDLRQTDGRTDRQTDKRTDICDCKVAFATEIVKFKYYYYVLICVEIHRS